MGVKIHYGPTTTGSWVHWDVKPDTGRWVFVVSAPEGELPYGISIARYAVLAQHHHKEWQVAGDEYGVLSTLCWWNGDDPPDPHACGLALLTFNTDKQEWSLETMNEEYAWAIDNKNQVALTLSADMQGFTTAAQAAGVAMSAIKDSLEKVTSGGMAVPAEMFAKAATFGASYGMGAGKLKNFVKGYGEKTGLPFPELVELCATIDTDHGVMPLVYLAGSNGNQYKVADIKHDFVKLTAPNANLSWDIESFGLDISNKLDKTGMLLVKPEQTFVMDSTHATEPQSLHDTMIDILAEGVAKDLEDKMLHGDTGAPFTGGTYTGKMHGGGPDLQQLPKISTGEAVVPNALGKLTMVALKKMIWDGYELAPGDKFVCSISHPQFVYIQDSGHAKLADPQKIAPAKKSGMFHKDGKYGTLTHNKPEQHHVAPDIGGVVVESYADHPPAWKSGTFGYWTKCGFDPLVAGRLLTKKKWEKGVRVRNLYVEFAKTGQKKFDFRVTGQLRTTKNVDGKPSVFWEKFDVIV